MNPSGLDPKVSQARPFFRAMMALLLLVLAGMLVFESIPLIMDPGPVEVACPTHTRKWTCEIGAAMVMSIPAGAQRALLGVSGLATAAGLLWTAWLFGWRLSR